MKEKSRQIQKICIEELVKQHPVLTKEEMDSFMSYEEILSEATRLFEKAIIKIQQEIKSMKTRRKDL